MPFNESQMTQFRELGYLAEPQFFTPRELAALRAELERFKRHGYLRNVTTEEDGQTHSQARQNLQMLPVFDKSLLARALPFHEKVLAAVNRLIGEPALLHLDQIFLKPGRTGQGTSWHQDNFYFGIPDPTKGVGMWIALHDATAENGTMNVVPAVFREKLEHRRDPMSDHHSRCDPDESAAVAIEVPAGGALFFNYGVPHCTRENRTDRERAGLALHFLREDYAPAALLAPDRRERPVLSGPNATGGEREYGIRVAGTWSQEVEKALKEV